jgi:hypothetical protein
MCPDAHQCSTRNRISFLDTDMGRQLHPSGRQANTVQTLSLIKQDVENNCNRPDASPYYENYVQRKCNRLDARATPFGRGPDMVLHKRVMESRLHSCPSGRPQFASGCHLEKSETDSI